MTRETKIGLLVGLAFIVVFAMLLSHSGPSAPPGDTLQLAKAREVLQQPRTIERPAPQPAKAAGEGDAAASPSAREVDPPQPSTPEGVTALPTPGILGPPVPSVPQDDSLDPVPTEMAAVENSHDMLEGRVAPPLPPDPVAAPEPTTRIELPKASPEPDTPTNVAPTPAPPQPTLPSEMPPPSRDYVVQKGETLNQICKDMYGSASNRVVEFFMKANHMKNKHMVVEGQKLLVPQLPPEMFERVTQLDVSQTDSARLARVDALVNGRRAPITTGTEQPAQTSTPTTRPKTTPEKSPADKLGSERLLAEKSEKTAKPIVKEAPRSTQSRVYEVKANDTFVSIARSQLGSGAAYKEIEKLNKGLDPTKIKPGTKIRLPGKRTPVSQASSSERKAV